MSDRIFLHLCPGWALGYNKLQWMIMKADKMPPEGVLSLPTARFRAVSFIACYKRVLIRVLREKGITPTPEAAEYIGSGFRCLKVKIGLEMEEDVERLKLLREAMPAARTTSSVAPTSVILRQRNARSRIGA